MDAAVRAAVESALGYTFGDECLLSRALTHASLTDERCDSNERMEFLGDAVLGLIVCESVYARYPKMLEGEMTKIKSLVVSRQSCADLAKELGLDKCLSMGKGMTAVGTSEIPLSLSAAVLESVRQARFPASQVARILPAAGAGRQVAPLTPPSLTPAGGSPPPHAASVPRSSGIDSLLMNGLKAW